MLITALFSFCGPLIPQGSDRITRRHRPAQLPNRRSDCSGL